MAAQKNSNTINFMNSFGDDSAFNDLSPIKAKGSEHKKSRDESFEFNLSPKKARDEL